MTEKDIRAIADMIQGLISADRLDRQGMLVDYDFLKEQIIQDLIREMEIHDDDEE